MSSNKVRKKWFMEIIVIALDELKKKVTNFFGDDYQCYLVGKKRFIWN